MTSTTTGRVEDMGDGVYMLCEPSVIVATDTAGKEVARFSNWAEADDFIARALATGGEYEIREVAI